MGSQRVDISRIQVQLTVARWHLHDAMSAVADVAVHKLQSARLAYAGIIRSLEEANLTRSEREQIARELSALQSRLERVSGAPAGPPPSSAREERR